MPLKLTSSGTAPWVGVAEATAVGVRFENRYRMRRIVPPFRSA